MLSELGKASAMMHQQRDLLPLFIAALLLVGFSISTGAILPLSSASSAPGGESHFRITSG